MNTTSFNDLNYHSFSFLSQQHTATNSLVELKMSWVAHIGGPANSN